MPAATGTRPSPTPALALAALGVVYGDIGTSPLYTIKEIFASPHHAPVPLTPDNVLGVLSLVLWALIIVVSIKYVGFVMRADNRGEGGIMALIALALGDAEGSARRRNFVVMIGILGAAMFYGDGMITPAISVLSAVEGLEVATPALKPVVVPVTIAVLVLLFAFQRHGTARVGALFGPVMAVWFLTLAGLGAVNLLRHPSVLLAVNPAYAVGFFLEQGALAFVILGAVVLAITGAEALYADMGHFGRKPIRLAWFGFVLPALLLNYFGQGALVLEHPDALANPFYHLAPGWALYPLVALATVATVIASQAVITGAFSVTRQAMQLGFVPRMAVQQTSETERGQIYVPFVNWALLAAVLALVLGFRSSSNLAAAYGIAVTGDMVITSILAAIVVSRVWGWGWPRAGLLFAGFLAVELAFFGANVLKIPDGGWFPIAVGILIFTLLTTWKRGRELLYARLKQDAIDLEPFIESLAYGEPHRVPGTAVFLTPNPRALPHALLHNLKHNRVLHEHVVILTVQALDVPRAPEEQRLRIEPLKLGFCRLKVNYGFMEEPDLPRALGACGEAGVAYDPMTTSFFIGRETLIPRIKSDMAYWREKLFVAMFRNSASASDFFRLPPNRVVEVGSQVTL